MAAPVRWIGAAFIAASAAFATALAVPEGADWNTVATAEGCGSCHLGASAPPAGAGLSIEGLPDKPAAGNTYPLTIVLEDPALVNAGFLLSVTAGESSAGRLEAVDERVEIEAGGNRARSTRAGSDQPEAGQGRWRLRWTAPGAPVPALMFELWANAGNDDLSPLGDRPWHRRWQLP